MPDVALAGLAIAPDLVEESVLREGNRREALGDPAPAEEYRGRRDAIDDGRREGEDAAAALAALHREWFLRFGFDAFLRERLDEIPGLAVPSGGVRVLRAMSHRDEGADLYRPLGAGGRPGAFTIVMRIRADSFGAPLPLRTRLRRDLFHVADMLDPESGYMPDPGSDLDPPARNLLRDRITVLWAISVAERARRLWPEEELLSEVQTGILLGRAFPEIPPGERADFAARVLGGSRMSYADVLALAARR